MRVWGFVQEQGNNKNQREDKQHKILVIYQKVTQTSQKTLHWH